MPSESYLRLLLDGADRAAFEGVLAETKDAQSHTLAMRLRDQLATHRTRESELTALYDTANDLAAIRDLDAVLAAIVRRARTLLRADMTYLSLNDEAEGASYMKVTDGALTPEFRTLRLPLGTGLLGLVAQAGAPYFTDDYQTDPRFVHRDFIDAAVAGEEIRAILGVPLFVEDKVIGALLAVHRTVRPFPAREVALLSSFAAHAAVAIENARLFEQARASIAVADEANQLLRARTASVERAARAHDRLTQVLLRGHGQGDGVAGIAVELAEVLDAQVGIFDERLRPLSGEAGLPQEGLPAALEHGLATGKVSQVAPGWTVATAAAGEEHLATLVVRRDEPLDEAEQRTVERAAMVTTLVLLSARTEADTEQRVRGELLADLLTAVEPDVPRLLERARSARTHLDGPLAILVAHVAGAEPARAQRSAAALATSRRGLAAVIDQRVVVVAPSPDALALGAELQRHLGPSEQVTVGVAQLPLDAEAESGGVGLVYAAREGYREARRCVDALLALGRQGSVCDPAGLGLARLLLGTAGPGELGDFVSATIGPVLDYDERRQGALVETLQAWFAAGGSLREAGAALHVHANTVAQRLDRITQLLGAGWRDPERALEVQLAVRLHLLRSA